MEKTVLRSRLQSPAAPARLSGLASAAFASGHEVSIPIAAEEDIVRARDTGRALCKLLGFSEVGQTKVATAISELSRNIVQYAGRGEVRLRSAGDGGIEVIATDRGPGIPDIAQVMSPAYRSMRGMGVGLKGTRRIVDELAIESQPGRGTTVTFRKRRA